MRDPFSHVASSIRADAFVPSPAQVAGADLIEVYLNSKRRKGQIAQQVTRPWVGKPGARPDGPVRKVDPDRRAALDRRLGISSE